MHCRPRKLVTRALGTELVKVVDFGIAKLSIDRATALTLPGKLFGTPLYMSPEQWDNAGVGPRSDVYSFGVVLYEMLTARLPITGGAMTEMAKNVALTTPKSMRVHRPTNSASLDALVLRCLAKEPNDRFAGMPDVIAALHGLGGSTRAPVRAHARYAIPVIAAIALLGAFAILRTREPVRPSAPLAASAPPPAMTSVLLPKESPTAVSSVAPSATAVTTGTVARPRGTPQADAGVRRPAPRPSEDDDLLRKK